MDTDAKLIEIGRMKGAQQVLDSLHGKIDPDRLIEAYEAFIRSINLDTVRKISEENRKASEVVL